MWRLLQKAVEWSWTLPLDEAAFLGHSSLQRIVIPADAFNQTDRLMRVEFSEDTTLNLIGFHAFRFSALTTIQIAKRVVLLGEGAFIDR